jgi:hypothetical protein
MPQCTDLRDDGWKCEKYKNPKTWQKLAATSFAYLLVLLVLLLTSGLVKKFDTAVAEIGLTLVVIIILVLGVFIAAVWTTAEKHKGNTLSYFTTGLAYAGATTYGFNAIVTVVTSSLGG